MDTVVDETRRYAFLTWFHRSSLPSKFVEHRSYFAREGRGFGDDAFHAFWFLLFKDFRPATVLEIGVFRGQTISLWQMLHNHFEISGSVVGLSPLSNAGDDVSRYGNLDYEADIGANFKQFFLQSPLLIRAFSDSPEGKSAIRNRRWDLIYVDGSHQFEAVWSDVKNAAFALVEGAILVLDDASLYSSFQAPDFSFAGHPGPSRVCLEQEFQDLFEEIGTCGHLRAFQRTNFPLSD